MAAIVEEQGATGPRASVLLQARGRDGSISAGRAGCAAVGNDARINVLSRGLGGGGEQKCIMYCRTFHSQVDRSNGRRSKNRKAGRQQGESKYARKKEEQNQEHGYGNPDCYCKTKTTAAFARHSRGGGEYAWGSRRELAAQRTRARQDGCRGILQSFGCAAGTAGARSPVVPGDAWTAYICRRFVLVVGDAWTAPGRLIVAGNALAPCPCGRRFDELNRFGRWQMQLLAGARRLCRARGRQGTLWQLMGGKIVLIGKGQR